MQTVEDALDLIAAQFSRHGARTALGGRVGDAWTVAFVRSVKLRVDRGDALTSRQADIVLRALSMVRGPLVGDGLASAEQVDRLLEQPRFRHAPQAGTRVPREVVHLGDNCLGFRFPWDPVLVERIKALGTLSSLSPPVFDCGHRVWIVPVSRHSLEAVIMLIGEERFGYDATVVGFLERCEAARDQPCLFGVDADGDRLHGVIHDNELLAAWAQHVAMGVRQ